MVGLNLKIFFNTVKENKLFTFLMGFFLLVLFISVKQSIWLDESLSIDFSRQGIKDIFYISMAADLHPPLYNLFLHYSGEVFGKEIWSYRLWSAIFYILTAAVLFNYLKYRDRLKDFKNNSYLFVSLFLLSPFAVYYASEARSYMLTILISLVQFIAFDKIFDESQNYKKQIFAYTSMSIIGIYVFYPIIFLLAAEFFYVILYKRNYFKKFIFSWILIFVSYLPWIYLVILNRIGEQPSHFLPIPWWQIPAIIFIGFSGGRVAVTDVNHTHDYWPTILISGIYALNFIGFFFWLKDKQDRDYFLRIIFIFFGPILISLLISFLRFPVFDPRYYAEVFPLFILILIFSSIYLSRYSIKMWKNFISFLIFVNILFLGLYGLNANYQREHWKSVVVELEKELQSGDKIVFIGHKQPPPSYSSYQTKSVEIVSTYPDDLKDVQDYNAIEKTLRNKLEDAERILYSQFLEWQKDPEHKIRGMVEDEFEYIKTIGFFKVKFDLYERKGK